RGLVEVRATLSALLSEDPSGAALVASLAERSLAAAPEPLRHALFQLALVEGAVSALEASHLWGETAPLDDQQTQDRLRALEDRCLLRRVGPDRWAMEPLL